VPRRVLIIDDTPEIADLLSLALRKHGYDTSVSGYTTAVSELLEREPADAVVFDCSAFDMSESLYDMLRDEPRHAGLPVVIVTDTPEEAVASLRARQARHVRLVPKPFRGSDVIAALEELLAAVVEGDRSRER
jgi:two-component system OmpR family response regulator